MAEGEGTAGKRVDLEEVARLVEALERDLERVKEGQGDVATLRGEVEALRSVLESASPHESGLHERLARVRTALEDLGDEIAVDTIGVGQYVVAIGRMLGLG
ncbi:MAG: hypothetical protein N2544_10895 [Burkholderiales bacterium]|nr:hypothetical protein [Burkholderiales bacterium]